MKGLKINFMALFHGRGLTVSRRLGNGLLLTTKFPGVLGAHLVNLRKVKS